jgi:hypothetical protein
VALHLELDDPAGKQRDTRAHKTHTHTADTQLNSNGIPVLMMHPVVGDTDFSPQSRAVALPEMTQQNKRAFCAGKGFSFGCGAEKG